MLTTQPAPGAGSAPVAGPISPLRRRFGRLAPLAPAVLLVVTLFVIPMAFMLTFSLWRTDPNFNLVPAWNLDNYARFITFPTYLRKFVKTIGMAARVTAACLTTTLFSSYFLAM